MRGRQPRQPRFAGKWEVAFQRQCEKDIREALASLDRAMTLREVNNAIRVGMFAIAAFDKAEATRQFLLTCLRRLEDLK